MGRIEGALAGAIGGLVLFVGVEVARSTARHAPPAAALAAGAPHAETRDEVEPGGPTRASTRAALAATHGTYLPEMLAAQDSVLHRWPRRPGSRPLRVWVQPHSDVTDWSPRLVQPARDAVLAWDEARLPVRLAVTGDSAGADVRVTWEQALEPPRIGVARTETDPEGWIVGATLRLAVHGPDGAPLDETTVRAAALHEVGHLLGLDHTGDTTAIMASHATSLDRLSPADIATAALLYRLRPGRVR